MPFQIPITIKQSIEAIHRKKYLLPAIQREFVWKPEQIIKLFDSLMRGYPIGSFLFWNVEGERINDFQFYEFIRSYHERDKTHNPKATTSGERSITAILDGQQRFTALYIGLRGSYAYKIRNRRWSSNDAFPERKLYLNLLSKSEDFDLLYDFQFLTAEEAEKIDEKEYWFEVGKIIDFDSFSDITQYLREHEDVLNDSAEKRLVNLYEIIHVKTIINYYDESSQELDKVLNIFIRVNSGGTVLSYSDLLLSIATAQWQSRDAREVITSFVDELNQIGDGFSFNKDFVLKSCLVLSDLKDIAFKVDNFNSANMSKIESEWNEIVKALKLAVELIASYGYTTHNLTSHNALIPIAYYIKKIGNPDAFVLSNNFSEVRKLIKRWLTLSLLKRAFSGQPDNVLRPIRKLIDASSNSFPLEEIVQHFKGTPKSIIFSDDDIENLLFSKYGVAHTFAVLSLLYPTIDFRNRFHMDHIHPRSRFTAAKLREANIHEEDQAFYIENYDYTGNLQLLEGLPNEEKSNKNFVDWLDEVYSNAQDRADYMNRHYIPQDISLAFSNFKEFINERNKLIKAKLREILL